MAKKITNTKPLFGNRRSHALNATKHAFKPNLQTVTINGKKYKIRSLGDNFEDKDVVIQFDEEGDI